MNILIYTPDPWIGDCIRLFNLIHSLQSGLPNCQVSIANKLNHNPFEHQLKQYNLQVKLEDFSLSMGLGTSMRQAYTIFVRSRYNQVPYDLVLNLNRSVKESVILRQVRAKYHYASTWGFRLCKPQGHISTLVRHKLNPTVCVDNVATLIGQPIKIESYPIQKINPNLFEEAKRLLPNANYVGFAVTQGHPREKKTWPVERFISVANYVVRTKRVPVFFVEKKHESLMKKIQQAVPSALFPETDTTLASPALVTALATRLEAAVTICCGVMHMLGLSETPLIGLFGPTEPLRTTSQIKNIHIIDSKVLYDSVDTHKITELDVIKVLSQILKTNAHESTLSDIATNTQRRIQEVTT